MTIQAEDFAPLETAPSLRLDGKVAIITGASSGLGLRFARVLHSAGASVTIAARRTDRLESVVASLGSERTLAVPCDVAVDADAERLVATAFEHFGAIDLLVNNAGIGNPMPAEDEPIEQWRKVIDVNLTALFLMCQLAGRSMLQRGSGSIINVASMLGLVASAPIKQASYTASKSAVVNLTRELGCQWADRGVRVNALAPGWFRTEMTSASMFDDERSMKFVRRNCPMRRGGEVHELDGALLFLASDLSSYVTGVTIPVDGGWTAR